MENKTLSHRLLIELSKQDLLNFIKQHCTEYLPSVEVTDILIQTGTEGARYSWSMKEETDSGLGKIEIQKTITIDLNPKTLREIINRYSINELSNKLKLDQTINMDDWKMSRINWHWENGATDSDKILNFTLEEITEKS